MSNCAPSALPFPEITGTADAQTLVNLHADLAGAVSEMTALCTYMYQHTVTDDESFGACMLQIAKDEMVHAEKLMEAIFVLGGDPRYQSESVMWNAGLADYEQDIRAQLNANIVAETNAIAAYTEHIEETTNASVKQLLERIICDERRHLAYFRQTLGSVCA